MSLPSIAVLCSGSGSNLQALFDHINNGNLPARIAWVLSNNGNSLALERARREKVEAIHASAKSLGSDEAVEALLLQKIEEAQVKVLVLAGYMKPLPKSVLHKLPNKVVNIHPSLLPAFGGKGMYGRHVHQAVLDRGVAVSGVTVHLVSEVYDEGPILAQRVVAVHPQDTADTLGARILKVEHDTLWRQVRALLPRSVSDV
jgi:phosphoribosylglycinamide formyltransferase-1